MAESYSVHPIAQCLKVAEPLTTVTPAIAHNLQEMEGGNQAQLQSSGPVWLTRGVMPQSGLEQQFRVPLVCANFQYEY